MIIVVPDVIPPITPVVEPAVPTPILLLLHVPPTGVEFNVVVYPIHTFIVPVIVVGKGLTVTIAYALQPVAKLYVIVAVPVVNTAPPVTSPVVDPILAITVALLLQIPPVGTSLNEVVRPAHTERVPLMAEGNAYTVTVAVIIQPVGKV